MNRTHVTLSVVLLVVTRVLPATSVAADPLRPASVDTLVKGNNAFAVNLYRELSASEGNLFFSPYGISSALGMTFFGARENTAKEMKGALNFELEQTQLHAAFKKLNQELVASARKAAQKLTIANGLCLTGGDVSEEFKALLNGNYDAEVFAGGLDKINGWVKHKTEGKIEKILESLDPDSVCVLLNAIYFKGTWESQFEKGSTRDAPFKVSSGKHVTVPLMYQKGGFRILEMWDFQAASIPYKGKQMSMVILLPRDEEGLTNLEKQLTDGVSMQNWLVQLDKAPVQEIEIYVPTFKLETDYNLVPSCKALGMTDAFVREKADFTGMGWQNGQLWISQIKHKAFVEVNEEGTEAAAATAVGAIAISAELELHPVFRADHPFLFIIRDNATGSILFMGRMVDPRSK